MSAARLVKATVRSPFGNDYGAIWNALTSAECVLDAEGAAAKDPDMRELNIDRKVVRTTDKQARLLLAAAIACTADLDDRTRNELGLYLGLPTVDEPMPQLAAVADWHEERGRTPLAEHFKRHSAPLGWLAMLNSSAAAHVSTRLGITGCNGVYSPFADAGLNALIDALIAVVDHECGQALVGAVAPKHDPMLAVQYANWCEREYALPPTEASTCVLVSRDERYVGARMLGFARGFAPMPWNETAASDVVARALLMAGLSPSQIGWTLCTFAWNHAQAVSMRAALTPFASTAASLPLELALGRMGPAAPLLALGLGMHGLERGESLHFDDNALVAMRPLVQRNFLIVAVSPQGQCAAVVIGDGL
jgi:Beta-ketoacyl synthase, N-terminal domain